MILNPGPGKAPEKPEKKVRKMRGSVNLDSLARSFQKRPLSIAAAWMRSVRERVRALGSVLAEWHRRAATEGERATASLTVRSGSGSAPFPYAHVVQALTWADGVLGGVVLFRGHAHRAIASRDRYVGP